MCQVRRVAGRGSGVSRLDELNRISASADRFASIETSALISEDGLMIARAENGAMNLEEVRVAGMAATLLNLGTGQPWNCPVARYRK